MTYSLGAVGFGHWFERLHAGIKNSDGIKVMKIAGISDISNKIDRLNAVGLSAENYYLIDKDSPVPESFFDQLDIVHVSDPNEFHAAQTKQSLSYGKFTITEKTWGVNKGEFDGVVKYIRENNYEEKAYLHLHYIDKLLTIQLPSMLESRVKEYGKIKNATATFFEAMRIDDLRRKSWLFSPKNGGLFMDWIHPYEVLHIGAKAHDVKTDDLELYSINEDYDSKNPTGILAEARVKGEFFAQDAKAKIRIAKGAPEDKKSARFVFESGAYLDLNYIDSTKEFASRDRGGWKFYKDGKLSEEGAPQGPNTSELFVQDIIRICKGGKREVGINDLSKIFESQWRYQELEKGKKLNEDQDKIQDFIEDGLNLNYSGGS